MMSLLSYKKNKIYKTKMPVDIRNHTKNMNIYIGICMTSVHIGCFPISNKKPMFSQFQLTTGWCWDSSGQFERLWRSLMENSNGKICWLVVATPLKNISQIGNLPQIGVKIKNRWNHHLVWENATFLGQWECLKSIGTFCRWKFPDWRSKSWDENLVTSKRKLGTHHFGMCK